MWLRSVGLIHTMRAINAITVLACGTLIFQPLWLTLLPNSSQWSKALTSTSGSSTLVKHKRRPNDYTIRQSRLTEPEISLNFVSSQSGLNQSVKLPHHNQRYGLFRLCVCKMATWICPLIGRMSQSPGCEWTIIANHGQNPLIIFMSMLRIKLYHGNACPLDMAMHTCTSKKKLKLLCEWGKRMVFMNMHAMPTKRDKWGKKENKMKYLFFFMSAKRKNCNFFPSRWRKLKQKERRRRRWNDKISRTRYTLRQIAPTKNGIL